MAGKVEGIAIDYHVVSCDVEIKQIKIGPFLISPARSGNPENVWIFNTTSGEGGEFKVVNLISAIALFFYKEF